MQILSANAVRNLQVHDNMYDDLEYLIAFCVTEQKEGLDHAKLLWAEKEDISEATKIRLQDLGYAVKWVDANPDGHYDISWRDVA
jgi:hypothetical protein